jgi:hypothetical protein
MVALGNLTERGELLIGGLKERGIYLV